MILNSELSLKRMGIVKLCWKLEDVLSDEYIKASGDIGIFLMTNGELVVVGDVVDGSGEGGETRPWELRTLHPTSQRIILYIRSCLSQVFEVF